MKNQKFKIGDRVLAKDNVNWCKTPAPGTIVDLYRREPVDGVYDYWVKFDSGPTLWSNVTGLIQKPPVIVITTDGKTTTATMRQGKTILKQATARCSDKDTFDFSEGARIAFERLQGREPFKKEEKKERPKKLVCVKCDGFFAKLAFTEGKAYKIRWFVDNLFATLNGGYSGHKKCDKHVVGFVPGQAEFIPFVED